MKPEGEERWETPVYHSYSLARKGISSMRRLEGGERGP